jgi:hypothetical protein
MPPLVINFIALCSEFPIAELAYKGLLARVRSQMMSQTSALTELPITASHCTFVLGTRQWVSIVFVDLLSIIC